MPDTSLLTPLEFHVVMALRRGASYGYALMKDVERQSRGRLTPDVGTLYRVLARLMAGDLVEECPPPADAPDTHRGRPRKYYGLTPHGVGAARAEAERLAELVELARDHDLLQGETS